MASIARKNLFEDIPRFIVAQAGIMFAVSLVTIQTGILEGYTRSTSRLIEQSSADLWVVSQDFLHTEVLLPLPVERWDQARNVAGVARAEGVLSRSALLRSPDGKIAPVRIYGFNPDGQLFANWKIPQGRLEDLKTPYTFLMERTSLGSLNLKQVGDQPRIGSLPAKLMGFTEDTQSMSSSAYVYTSLETANAYLNTGSTGNLNCKLVGDDLQCGSLNLTAPAANTVPETVPPPRRLNLSDMVTFILVQAQPGEDLEGLGRRLAEALPGTQVFTKAEITQMTRRYWRQRTGVGFILGLGAVVGVIVGMVVVSQILYASVSDHIREFGTLKAMGASDWVIYQVITEQSLWMAVLGYIPSMLLCWGLGSWTMAAKGIMILITPATAGVVFGVTVVMCVGSALFAIQRVTHVDPAVVFKA
jgi:putative ABC transport system permease protein